MIVRVITTYEMVDEYEVKDTGNLNKTKDYVKSLKKKSDKWESYGMLGFKRISSKYIANPDTDKETII